MDSSLRDADEPTQIIIQVLSASFLNFMDYKFSATFLRTLYCSMLPMYLLTGNSHILYNIPVPRPIFFTFIFFLLHKSNKFDC